MWKILGVLAFGVAMIYGTVEGAKQSTVGAREALLDQGYTNVKMTGTQFTGCAENDLYRNGFTATGPTGRPVTGVVCSGAFKDYTIRTGR